MPPRCHRCDRELTRPGALVFSPPCVGAGRTDKVHLCVRCWQVVADLLGLAQYTPRCCRFD